MKVLKMFGGALSAVVVGAILLLMPFLWAEAAEDVLYSNATSSATASSTFESSVIDASGHTGLVFSFDYDSTALDATGPDTFSYGFKVGSDETVLGTIEGEVGASTTLETGNIEESLPMAAEVDNLVLFVSVDANTDSDEVMLTNISLTGTTTGEVVDMCPNIEGDQVEVPEGYEIDESGDCVEIEVVDMCPNIEGDQETVPEGYELDESGDCVEMVIDVCPNIEGDQTEIPDGYELDESGDCVEIVEPVDMCPNIEGDQAEVPEGYEIDEGGDCVEIVDPVDVCPNIEGDQETVPEGYELDESGDCVEIVVDVCPNLEGDQEEVPEGYEIDESGDCVEIIIDMCPNIEGDQETVPEGYELDESGDCVEIDTSLDCPAGYADWYNKVVRRGASEWVDLVRSDNGRYDLGTRSKRRAGSMRPVDVSDYRNLDRIAHMCKVRG